jgi:uncharacterized protein YxeA
MKKIMSLMLGLSLVVGTATFALAQDKDTSKKTMKKEKDTSKKKAPKKGTDKKTS